MTVDLLTNTAYGYPRGEKRRIAPRRLACIHITANPRTPPATAQQERDYANRDGSNGPSAHVYIGRTADRVDAIDTAYAAWSNGVLRNPKLTVPGVSEVVALAASGHNPNEDYLREYEICGRNPDYPITSDQEMEVADQIAADSLATGLPIERATVHLHSDLDTVNRPNCPVPASQAERFVARIISAALDERDRLELIALRAQVARLEAIVNAQTLTLTDKDAMIAGLREDVTEVVAWGKRLQGFGGAILATDPPEWVL